MNEYSRELMHMTTSEKADYNRRYYQRNKQYWKDYYKTGHGIGRKPGALSGVDQNYRDKAVGNDPGATSIKFRETLPDGRTKYSYHKSNADYYRSKHKSLDNYNPEYVKEKMGQIRDLREEARIKESKAAQLRAMEEYNSKAFNTHMGITDDTGRGHKDYRNEAAKASAKANMIQGDLVRNQIIANSTGKYRNQAGPRTANIEKTVGVALKSALTRSVRSIKSNANKAMKFIESLFK